MTVNNGRDQTTRLREVHLLHTSERKTAERIETHDKVLLTQRERTIASQHTRYERVETPAPLVASTASTTARDAVTVTQAPPAPTLALVSGPALPGEADTPTQVPAGVAEPSRQRAAGSAAVMAAAGGVVPDIEQIADQVLRRIERRAIAQRERMGGG